MNERFEKLAEQAGCSIDGMGYGEGNIEKFAELIVRECANYLDTFNKENRVEEGMDGAYMKAHFGVDQ